MDFNIFKNIFKFKINNVNYMIKDLHDENKRLQQYLDSSKPLFEAYKLSTSPDELYPAIKEFIEWKERDFKECEDRIQRNREFILKLQQESK